MKKEFSLMIKPVGASCNMRCAYCYYLGTQTGTDRHARMTEETLETVIRNYIASVPGPVVRFTWHGGEPTLAGLDFYREAVRLEQKYLPEGWECWNNLQTNGLLLDEAWCAFLAEEHFDVGVSIDGTQMVHDLYRRDVRGEGTYEKVRDSIRRLQEHSLQPDLLCTVTEETARRGAEVYRALRDLGTGWMQFIPILQQPQQVSSESYGNFLKDVFAAWFYRDLARTQVQLFSEMIRVLQGGSPGLCWMAPVCGNVLIAENDGSIYACDHFVDPEHRIGSACKEPLQTLLQLPEQERFGNRKREALTAQCRACPYLEMCGGGCLKDRFSLSADGEPGQYDLCGGLYAFFDYAVPRLRRAIELAAKDPSPSELLQTLIAEERGRYRKTGRNDPCPCGSGKKFKNCCQKRVL